MLADRYLLIVILVPIPPPVRTPKTQDTPIVRVTPCGWDPRLERVEVIDPKGNSGQTFFRPRVRIINP